MSSSTVNSAVIDRAFEDNPPLQKRVYSAIASTPEHASLFEDIAKYTSALRSGLGGGSFASSQLRVAALAEGPAAKKRKLINGGAGVGEGGGASSANDAALLAGLTADSELQFYIQDLSFAIPQRKKLRLELTLLTASATGVREGYLRARNQEILLYFHMVLFCDC
ncbi:histone chaperone RTT106 [Emergomyces africanus]|uniref:Histone chaperone RTT106 n=1 Tax=Emergomyces africanus TaxID=1955775 RepID=A0A1B7NMR4_9EURO|nr:histone chaperone RTT106 [Emergomyces africanus]